MSSRSEVVPRENFLGTIEDTLCNCTASDRYGSTDGKYKEDDEIPGYISLRDLSHSISRTIL